MKKMQFVQKDRDVLVLNRKYDNEYFCVINTNEIYK